MNASCFRITVFLIVSVFIVMSTVNVFACNLCLASYLSGDVTETTDENVISDATDRQGFACCCSFLQRNCNNVRSKRLQNEMDADETLPPAISLAMPQHHAVQVDVASPSPHPDIVSPTILAHRTVVLLN